MRDANELVRVLKKAALDAVVASKPMDVRFGKVQSVHPLEIYVDQKLQLKEKQLVLTRNVTDYDVDITVNTVTEYQSGGSGDSSFASHNHTIAGKQKITVHNGLVVGDKVLLLRLPGGQKYIVWDRCGT